MSHKLIINGVEHVVMPVVPTKDMNNGVYAAVEDSLQPEDIYSNALAAAPPEPTEAVARLVEAARSDAELHKSARSGLQDALAPFEGEK